MEDAKLISRNSLFQLVNSAVQDYLNPRRLALCMKTYKSTTGDRTLTRRGRALRENGGSGCGRLNEFQQPLIPSGITHTHNIHVCSAFCDHDIVELG